MFERLANATLKIQCGNGSGSGFHFVKDNIIVTNYHVIEGHLTQGLSVIAITEQRQSLRLKLLAYSDNNNYDYAVFELLDSLPAGREVLQPKIQPNVRRGTEICFGGYPHGINDLLVHKAYVSGPFGQIGFYIDGSVNGGNSGGPIVDPLDFSVIGIVTQRRFLGGGQLEGISNKAMQLQQHCAQIAGRGSVNIMGIDFTQLVSIIGESFSLSSEIIKANANSGIGIGFNIAHVTRDCQLKGII